MKMTNIIIVTTILNGSDFFALLSGPGLTCYCSTFHFEHVPTACSDVLELAQWRHLGGAGTG